MLYVYLWLKAWMSEEEGQDLIEYVLIAGLDCFGCCRGNYGLAALSRSWSALMAALADL